MKTTGKSGFLSLFLYVLAAGLASMFLHYTFASLIPITLIWVIKFLLPLLFGAAWYLTRTGSRTRTFSGINFAFFTMNTSFLLTFLLASPLQDLFGLDTDTADGLALVKLVEALLFISSAILITLLSGEKLTGIYIAKGKLGWGLIIGILTFTGMIILGLNQPGETSITTSFLLKFAPWLLIFSFANAFMEELMVRGLFLQRMGLPAWSANLVTTIFFTAAHMTVNYTQEILQFLVILLVLSFLWGFIMQKTRSIIASVFFHAGADVTIMLSVFSTMGISS